MPVNTIMEIVDNDPGLYEEFQRLLLRWYKRGERWTQDRAMNEALGKAAFFAHAIGQGHGQGHIRKAAKEMLQEFEQFKKYHHEKLQKVKDSEAQEARLVQFWESSLTPEVAAQARRYEELARKGNLVILREVLKESLPVKVEVIRSLLQKGDYNLENIPSEAWIYAAEQVPYLPGQGLSTEEKIELLKHIARWHYGA